jgi:hypothetical protein
MRLLTRRATQRRIAARRHGRSILGHVRATRADRGACGSVDACVEAAYCDSAAGCVAKKPTGSACSDIRQCVSSSCVNGVCTDEGFATDVCSGSVL